MRALTLMTGRIFYDSLEKERQRARSVRRSAISSLRQTKIIGSKIFFNHVWYKGKPLCELTRASGWYKSMIEFDPGAQKILCLECAFKMRDG